MAAKSWELVHFEPENAQPLLDVCFADASRGVAVGAYGLIYTTTDGGAVWSQVPFEPEPLPGAAKVEAAADDMEAEVDLGFEFHLNAIARGPPGRMYLGAEAGRLFRSDDDGAHWRELPSPYDGSFHGVLALDGEAVLAFGLRGNLYRSEDGGMNWTAIPTGTSVLLNSGARIDEQTVVIAGMAGVLLVSRDGGRSFDLSQQADRKAFSAVVPSGDGELIVAGEGGVRRLAVPAGRREMKESGEARIAAWLEPHVFGHRTIILGLFAIVTVALGWIAATGLKLDTNFNKQLPLQHEYIRTYLDHKEEFGGANRLLDRGDFPRRQHVHAGVLPGAQDRDGRGLLHQGRRPRARAVALDAEYALHRGRRGRHRGRRRHPFGFPAGCRRARAGPREHPEGRHRGPPRRERLFRRDGQRAAARRRPGDRARLSTTSRSRRSSRRRSARASSATRWRCASRRPFPCT